MLWCGVVAFSITPESEMVRSISADLHGINCSGPARSLTSQTIFQFHTTHDSHALHEFTADNRETSERPTHKCALD